MVPSTSGSPGAIVALIQAELLRKEKFVAVLGADIVDTWPLDWALWENPGVCLTDPLKANSMRFFVEPTKVCFCSGLERGSVETFSRFT